MLHLSHLLTPIQRHHPEVVSDFIANYCTLADTPGDDTYHYGWGSLKWALSYVAQEDPSNVGLMLFNLLCESIAKDLDNTYFETGILKFHSLKNFKNELREQDPIDVTALPYEIIGNYKVVINTTGRQIAAMILRKIPNANIIISLHKGSYPSVTIRKKVSDNNLEEQILDLLGTEDGGWKLLSNPTGATLINNIPIDITPERIIKIITPALIV
jgi:hypothetical protein